MTLSPAQTALITELANGILARVIDPKQPKLRFKPGIGNVDSKGRVHILNANVTAAQAEAREMLARLASGNITGQATSATLGASQVIEGLKIAARRAGC